MRVGTSIVLTTIILLCSITHPTSQTDSNTSCDLENMIGKHTNLPHWSSLFPNSNDSNTIKKSNIGSDIQRALSEMQT